MTRKSTMMAAGGGVAALAFACTLGLSSVSAASSGQTLADKIAATFHLKASEVQKVIDQNRAEHRDAREQKFEERLSQLVKDGKITEAQKQLIIAKRRSLEAERQASRVADKSLTPAERHAKRATKRTELVAWAKTNGIPIDLLKPGHGRGAGHGDMMDKAGVPDPSSATDPAD